MGIVNTAGIVNTVNTANDAEEPDARYGAEVPPPPDCAEMTSTSRAAPDAVREAGEVAGFG